MPWRIALTARGHKITGAALGSIGATPSVSARVLRRGRVTAPVTPIVRSTAALAIGQCGRRTDGYEAFRKVSRSMADVPDGVTHWEGPGLDAWRPWTPSEAAGLLRASNVPWCVVGGWAIDLFLGAPTRPHEDLEIGVPRADFTAVRRTLSSFEFFVVGDGEVRGLPPGGMPPDDKHQNWVLDVDANVWRMDVMLEPGDARVWTFRRDPSISAPREFMVDRTADSVPFLAPQGVLLYKAKAPRPKDEADFSACLPRLTPPTRTWLRDALQRVHPGHPWIEQLR